MAQSKLAEYQSLREEVGRRSGLQNQVLHLYVLSVAGGAALIGTSLSTQALLLALGLVGPIFGYWYFDQALGIETIGRYLAGDVEPSINRSIENVEGHLRWERGYRIVDPSIKLAIQNLQMLQIMTFLGLTLVACFMAIGQVFMIVVDVVKNGDFGFFRAAILVGLLLYLPAAFYLGRSLYRTYLNWVYLINNRRSALSSHAIRRFLEFTVTNGFGAAVTSFSPIRSRAPSNTESGQVAAMPPAGSDIDGAVISPFSPIGQLTSPEKQDAVKRLSLHCFDKYQGRVAIHVNPLEEYEAGEAILDHLRVVFGFNQSPDPGISADLDSQLTVRIEFAPTTKSRLMQPLQCTGTFTIQNEEVIDLSDDTLEALQCLFNESEAVQLSMR